MTTSANTVGLAHEQYLSRNLETINAKVVPKSSVYHGVGKYDFVAQLNRKYGSGHLV